MRNLYQRYQTDQTAENEGVELDFGEGVFVTVRSMDSARVRDYQAKQLRKHRQTVMANGGMLPPALLDRMEAEVLAFHVVVSWKGVTDAAGKELPFTTENALKLFMDLREFRREVASLAGMSETFRKEALEQTKGN